MNVFRVFVFINSFVPFSKPVFASALIPLAVGFVWYNPKTFGNAWMKEVNLDDEKIKGANMPLIFGLTALFAVMLAFGGLYSIVIHQAGVHSLFVGTENDPEAQALLKTVMDKYGTSYRTFKHGALHGWIATLAIVLPVLGTNALFERRGFKYIAINVGYWAVSLVLMGGVICQWG
jgi:hypothetical protein